MSTFENSEQFVAEYIKTENAFPAYAEVWQEAQAQIKGEIAEIIPKFECELIDGFREPYYTLSKQDYNKLRQLAAPEGNNET